MYTYVACTCPCTPTVPWERNSILLWQLERKIWKINPTKPECDDSVFNFCDERHQRCTYVYMLSKIRKVQSTLPKSPRTRTLALPWSWTLLMFSSGFIPPSSATESNSSLVIFRTMSCWLFASHGEKATPNQVIHLFWTVGKQSP